jgi:hypothetical protein
MARIEENGFRHRAGSAWRRRLRARVKRALLFDCIGEPSERIMAPTQWRLQQVPRAGNIKRAEWPGGCAHQANCHFA